MSETQRAETDINKAANRNLMTNGSVSQKIISFAIPIFLGNLFQQLYNTADSVIVGNFIGSNALAAVSSAGNLIFLVIGFFNGISIGAGVVIANFIGAKQEKRVESAVHTTVALGLFFFLCAYTHFIAATMRGAGRPGVPLVVFLVCWCLMRVLILSIFDPIFRSVYITHWVYPITWSLSSITLTILYKKMNITSKGTI